MFPRLKQSACGYDSFLYFRIRIDCVFWVLPVLFFSSDSHHPPDGQKPNLHFASVSVPEPGSPSLQSVQWFLRRNRSVSPAQLGWLYASLCVVSLGIATFFWFQGATFIMPFAWLELAAVGAAFLVYARHALDGEKILLEGPYLLVELEIAGHTERVQFNRQWVRVEPESGDGSLIQVSGQGQSVRVGRHVRPELRPALAREIRLALRGFQAWRGR